MINFESDQAYKSHHPDCPCCSAKEVDDDYIYKCGYCFDKTENSDEVCDECKIALKEMI